MSVNRHAQVTVFIIIAIIVVAAGGLTYVINKNSSVDDDFFSQAKTPELNNLKDSILDCRDSGAADALETIGIQGGYYDKPLRNFDMGWAFLSYYYYEGEFLMPPKEKVQTELSKAFDSKFTECIDKLNFDKFEVTHKTSKTKSIITKGNILFNTDMSLSIKSDNSSSTTIEMKDAPLNVNSSLYDILEIAAYITDSHKEDPNMLCVTCVADMAEERNLYVNAFDVQESSVLYIISENYTSSTLYAFDFLNKYKVNVSEVVSSVPAPTSSI